MSRFKWMGGDCYLLAVALHELSTLPIYGLVDGTGIHHAFVYDAKSKIGLDVRGPQSLKDLRAGCAGQTLKKITKREIREINDRYSDEEYAEALDVGRHVVSGTEYWVNP